MAPKKDTTVTPATRQRLPRAAKDKPKEAPEPIFKTTPKTIKKTVGRPKKLVPTKISISEASSPRGAKGKGKEKATEIGTRKVSPNSSFNNEIIRQEANYPNPFSTESSRKNTAALLSKWDSTISPGLVSPKLGKRSINGTPKSKSSRSAKSKHDRATSTSDKPHIAIPPPSSRDRGEQTSRLFDANKQYRLSSLAEGKFPDPTYPRASISDATEPSPGFSAAMGFKYSPGFGGPRGFNTTPINQFAFNPARNSSAIPGTGVLSSSEQIKPAEPTDSSAGAGPSSQVDGVWAGLSPSKDTTTVPDPENLEQFTRDWNSFIEYRNKRAAQNFGPPVDQQAPPYGKWFGSGYPKSYNFTTPEYNTKQADFFMPDWPQNYHPAIPSYPSMPSYQSWASFPSIASHYSWPNYPLFANFESVPANLEYEKEPAQEQTSKSPSAENSLAAQSPDPLGIRESRLTREKTMFVPGGKIVKTTTTIFEPTDEGKKKGKNVEKVPEEKVGIVVVDKEGNVDVESGDWLAGFNRIEGWEVEALLGESRKWHSRKNENHVKKKGVAKKPTSKKTTSLKKAVAPARPLASPKPTEPPSPNITKPLPPELTKPPSPPFRQPVTPVTPNLDFIPFDFPTSFNMRSTRSRATKISKPSPQSTKKTAAKKATSKAKSEKPTPKAKGKGKAAASKVTKVTKVASSPARSLRSINSPSKSKTSVETQASTKSSTSKSKASKSTKQKRINAKTKDTPSEHKDSPTEPEYTVKVSLGEPPTRDPNKPEFKPAQRAFGEFAKNRSGGFRASSGSGLGASASSGLADEHTIAEGFFGASSGNDPQSNDFTSNTTELERQVQRNLDLANQAAENMERFRGKAADQATNAFEAYTGFVEGARKELERRKHE